MMKIGVIGVGNMGKHHVRVYYTFPGVEIIGISDINKDTAKSTAKKYNIKAYFDHRELLKKDLDAVSIVVPTHLHKKIAVDFIKKGINVLIEKPIANSLWDAKEIIKQAEISNIKLMIGHIERFNPAIIQLKKILGKEKLIVLDIRRVGPFPPRVKDVGVLIDLGVHDIDLIRHLTNSDFKKIFALSSTNLSRKEDTAILSFKMKSGTLAHITTDWLTPYKVREITAIVKNKLYRADLINQKISEFSSYKEDGSYIIKEIPINFQEPLKLELESFIECVKKNKNPPVSGEDGLKALEVALKCLKISKEI